MGNGDLNLLNIPQQVSALVGLKVSKIAAGGWHSCAITDGGDLYSWGWNNYGQLGYPFDDKDDSEKGIVGLSATPLFVEIESQEDFELQDVACGARHTVVLSSKEKSLEICFVSIF